MEKLIKDNILYLLVIVLAFGLGVFLLYTNGTKAFTSISSMNAKKDELNTKREKLEQVKAQKIRQKQLEEEQAKREVKASKIIYEVSGQQFSAEASFGIMFDNMLTNMTNSGIRIRSIDYNYAPTDDSILESNIPGYNACELSFVAIGTYAQFQSFFKNLTKETYLTNINEIYIEPYDKDKSILIARFKVRLYTKTT